MYLILMIPFFIPLYGTLRLKGRIKERQMLAPIVGEQRTIRTLNFSKTPEHDHTIAYR